MKSLVALLVASAGMWFAAPTQARADEVQLAERSTTAGAVRFADFGNRDQVTIEEVDRRGRWYGGRHYGYRPHYGYGGYGYRSYYRPYYGYGWNRPYYGYGYGYRPYYGYGYRYGYRPGFSIWF